MADDATDDRLGAHRFRALANAYGGVVMRWPEPDRTAARRLQAEPFAAAVLASALALDGALDGWQVPGPAPALAERIAAARNGRRGDAVRRLRLWWSGLGLAATLAGATAGAATVALVAPVEGASGVGTAFGDVSGQAG